MTRSKKVLLILFYFISGVLSASFFSVSNSLLYFIALLTAVTFFLTKKIFFVLILVTFFLIGFFRCDLTLTNFISSTVLPYHRQEVWIEGKIFGRLEVGQYQDRAIIKPVKINHNILVGTTDILVFVPKFSHLNPGDLIGFKCFLIEPQKLEGFDYPKYLAGRNISTICRQPQELIFLKKCHDWHCRGLAGFFGLTANKLEKQIYQILPSPHSELMQGILFGNTSGLSQELKEIFQQTGTTHLMAVSGLNLTILTFLVTNLFFSFGISRKKTLFMTSVFIFIYLGLVGFSASSVRAGIMGMLASVAIISGRLNIQLNSIFFAASFLLLFKPLALVTDLGFQLSFLAMLGLYYFLPFFQHIFRFLPEKFEFRSSLSMTLAAQTFVLPWLLYKFGLLSIISPLANILILPFMPGLMGGGLALLLFSFIGGPIVSFASWPLFIVLDYLIKIVGWCAHLPFAYLQITFPLWLLCLIYGIFFVIIYWRRKFLITKV